MVLDIYVFIKLANFYYCFIKDFSMIAAFFTSMLKTTTNINFIRLIEVSKKFEILQKSAKSKKSDFAKNRAFSIDFLISKAKRAFFSLRKVYIEVWILHNFDLRHHIQIETDVLDCIIVRVFTQPTLDQSFSHHITFGNIENLSKSFF